MRKKQRLITFVKSSNLAMLPFIILIIMLNASNGYATTYFFDGTVTQTWFSQPSGSNLLPLTLPGDTFTGYISYNFQQTPVPDHTTNTSAIYGASSNLIISYAIYLNNLTVFSASNTYREIDISTASFVLTDPVPSTTPNLNIANGVPFPCIDEANFIFANSTGPVLNGTSLTETLDFSLFDTKKLILDGVGGGGPVVSLSLDGDINNIHESQPVPEPATILLIAVGLGGIVFLRRREPSSK